MKITTKGQVTIPQDLRRKYRLDPSCEVEFVDEDGRILLRILKPQAPRFRKMLGKGDVQLSTEEILALTRGE
jgi:AbrB family looped-hinge helix DNA binding protein